MDTQETYLPKKSELKSIFFHNLSNEEISTFLRAINQVIPSELRKNFVFARTTETSLKMTVEEWIDDTASDHLYLLENPPTQEQKQEASQEKAADHGAK